MGAFAVGTITKNPDLASANPTPPYQFGVLRYVIPGISANKGAALRNSNA